MKNMQTLTDILKKFDCQTGTLHALDPSTQHLRLLAQQGVPDFLLDKIDHIPIGKGIAGCAAERADAVQMCNLQTDTSGVARPDAKQTKVEGALAVPIFDSHKKVVGVLGIGKIQPYEFSDVEISALREIADSLAPTLSLPPA